MNAVLESEKTLESYRIRCEMARLRAQLRVCRDAEEAAKIQAQLMLAQESSGAERQRAAKDILDRAGICTGADGQREIVITFGKGAPKLGMPKRGKE